MIYSNLLLTKPISIMPSPVETDPSPIMSELTKKTTFFRFLQKEISSAKTEAEKEAVFGILTKTKIQIRALQVELKRIQDHLQPHGQGDSRQASDLFRTHSLQ